MRRLFVTGVVIALFAASLPAFGVEKGATNYRSQHNTAMARFGDYSADRGVLVAMGESIGGMENPVYGYLEIWDNGMYCDGMSVEGGPESVVHDYYFRNNGAYLNADIEVACGYGATPFFVHVEVTWNASGAPDIETDQHKMEFDGHKFIGVNKVVMPKITSVDISVDYPLTGPLPALFEASERLFTGHGVSIRP